MIRKSYQHQSTDFLQHVLVPELSLTFAKLLNPHNSCCSPIRRLTSKIPKTSGSASVTVCIETVHYTNTLVTFWHHETEMTPDKRSHDKLLWHWLCFFLFLPTTVDMFEMKNLLMGTSVHFTVHIDTVMLHSNIWSSLLPLFLITNVHILCLEYDISVNYLSCQNAEL